MSDLVLKPGKGMPADAMVLAAAELRKIRARYRAALKRPAFAQSLDAYGRAHFADMDSRISRVLDARVAIPAGQ